MMLINNDNDGNDGDDGNDDDIDDDDVEDDDDKDGAIFMIMMITLSITNFFQSLDIKSHTTGIRWQLHTSQTYTYNVR